MFKVQTCTLPDGALLEQYVRSHDYTDCFRIDVAAGISHAQYVTAFYTSVVFKLERWILKWLVSRPSSDADARQLAEGLIDHFAAWQVEGRAENQLLMCDFHGRTRSWLMVSGSDHPALTRLYFGSAIVLQHDPETGQASMRRGFRLLLGFHKLYSRVLLYAAKKRLSRQVS